MFSVDGWSVDRDRVEEVESGIEDGGQGGERVLGSGAM